MSSVSKASLETNQGQPQGSQSQQLDSLSSRVGEVFQNAQTEQAASSSQLDWALDVTFTPSNPLETVEMECTEVAGFCGSFKVVYDIPSESGRVYRYSRIVQLSEEQRKEAEGHFLQLKNEFPNMKYIDLQMLLVHQNDEDFHEVSGEHPSIVRLREIYSEADSKNQTKLPVYHEHGCGNTHGKTCFPLLSERGRAIFGWDADKLIESHSEIGRLVTEDKKAKLNWMKDFLKANLDQTQKMIGEAEEKNAKENLESWKSQLERLSEFVIASVILLEGEISHSNAAQYAQYFTEIFQGVKGEQPANFFKRYVLRQTENKATRWEKECVMDLLLTTAKSRKDRYRLCKALGHADKLDSPEWVFLNCLNKKDQPEEAAKALLGHPLFEAQWKAMPAKSKEEYRTFLLGKLAG